MLFRTLGVLGRKTWPCYRYLGFTFSNRGAVQGVNILSQSGLKTLRVTCITNKVQQLGGLELDLQIKLFNTLVEPILTYGCEIWGARKFDCLEKVLLKFCTGLLGVPPATTAAVLGELGWFPMWMITQLHVINYWMRSKLGTAPVLVKEAVRLSEAMSACITLWLLVHKSEEGMEVEISSGLIGCSSRISTLEPYLLQIKDSAMRSLSAFA